MQKNFSRREFLNITGLVSAGLALPQWFLKPSAEQPAGGGQNVLIVLFDSWSAYHLSLYSYARRTTPQIERLAERAIVYHNHIAGGNYTLPGTTSLLTGMLSWKHRAFGFPIDQVQNLFAERNIFHLFPDYHRMAYTHNRLANQVLEYLFRDLDDFTPLRQHLLHDDFWVSNLFAGDDDIATLSWLRALKPQEADFNYSLFFSRIYQANLQRTFLEYDKLFPLGLPRFNIDNFYLLEDAIDWMIEALPSAPQPFLGYYHFLPPHYPYNTRADFYKAFSGDGRAPQRKAESLFSERASYELLIQEARHYDEFILYVDSEFARLYERLEQSGVLNSTWLILTSDHGELFERGVRGHGGPLLYHPVIKIPLLIFPPGQTTRQDVYENTSAVDLLPTLLEITGRGDRKPDWTEGQVLPPFGKESRKDIFVVEGLQTEQNRPMDSGTIIVLREKYKLIYYFGYEKLGGMEEMVELYDLDNDPEELEDLALVHADLAADLLNTAKEKRAENDRPFLSNG